MKAIISMPITRNGIPISAYLLYFPDFDIQRPDSVLSTIIAIDIGILTKPDTVGEMPSTP
ncbi:hypothetical protein D3C80_1703640 [compost metagenome]